MKLNNESGMGGWVGSYVGPQYCKEMVEGAG